MDAIAGRDNGTMMRDPNWYFEAHPELNTTTKQIGYAANPYTTYTGMSDFANGTHQASDSTDLLRSWLTYKDALENDTTSVTTMSTADRAAISYMYK